MPWYWWGDSDRASDDSQQPWRWCGGRKQYVSASSAHNGYLDEDLCRVAMLVLLTMTFCVWHFRCSAPFLYLFNFRDQHYKVRTRRSVSKSSRVHWSPMTASAVRIASRNGNGARSFVWMGNAIDCANSLIHLRNVFFAFMIQRWIVCLCVTCVLRVQLSHLHIIRSILPFVRCHFYSLDERHTVNIASAANTEKYEWTCERISRVHRVKANVIHPHRHRHTHNAFDCAFILTSMQLAVGCWMTLTIYRIYYNCQCLLHSLTHSCLHSFTLIVRRRRRRHGSFRSHSFSASSASHRGKYVWISCRNYEIAN